jgi:F-type H+-transporting ATPase subunit alpha
VISITDGQIYLETDLFNAGIRPAINVGISVSRVGGAAQRRAMRQVAGRLRLDMAAFRELAAFAQFGSDLDKETQSQLDRGQRLTEILKQSQFRPYSLAHQVQVIYAGTRGYADGVPLDDMDEWEADLLRYLDTQYPEIGQGIRETYRLTEENEARLQEALRAFMQGWGG